MRSNGIGAWLVLLTVACGGGEDPPEVRSIEEIIAGEIAVSELQPTSAAVAISTTVDVVCSVVFGVDTSYGQISTDLDMGGAAHSDHFAQLRGLEPDTVYHYRLQGAGADGTLYVSEDLTFRTPPADADSGANEGTNVAALSAGAEVIEVSSVYADSPDWAAEHAIDGDPATEWSSDGDGDDAFITIQLTEPTALAAVGIWTRTMGSSAEITRFQVIADGEVTLGPFDVTGASAMQTFNVDVTAQTLRFEVVESSGGNTGLVELGAFGAE